MLPAQTWKEGKRTKQRICRNTHYFELKREYTRLSGQDLRQIKGRQPYLKCFCIHENTCFQIINLFTIILHCVYIYTNLRILFLKSKHLLQVHASKFAMSRCGKYSNHARNCIQMSMSIMESFCQYEISCAVLTRLWYRSHSFPVLDISCKSLSLSSRLPPSLSPILCLTSAASV